jgi:hypothetical protein
MTCLSQHAISRRQKRGIPPIIIDWLEQYGEEHFDGHGGVIRYFGHDSRRRMEKVLGRRFVAENQKYLDHYLVESASDGTIITMGMRFKRISRR